MEAGWKQAGNRLADRLATFLAMWLISKEKAGSRLPGLNECEGASRWDRAG
jgi:hypothetical protein